MLTMNYAQLVTAIEDYTETSEATFVSQIPNFVQLAEEREQAVRRETTHVRRRDGGG